MPSAPCGEYAQQWLVYKGGAPDAEFVNSLLGRHYQQSPRTRGMHFAVFKFS